MRHLPLVIVLALCACAPTTQQVATTSGEGRTCFLERQVDSFAAQGIDVVNIKVLDDYFRLTLAEACPEIQEADRIQLVPRTRGMICVNQPADSTVVAYSKVTGPRRCLVKTMQRLTPTEVASLPAKEKP